MPLTAPVDFRQVVDAFNQSSGPSELDCGKLDRASANFDAHVKIELKDSQWNKMMLEYNRSNVKEVKMDTRQPDVTTTVTVGSNVPGSKLNICSGHLTGLSSKTATATIKMPEDLGGDKMNLDLTKTDQSIVIPNPGGAGGFYKNISGSGSVTVNSKAKVYQGDFEATAHLSGDATFISRDGSTQVVPIELMAGYARGTLPKQFSTDGRTLSWKVRGCMDYLLENVTVSN